MQPAETRQTGIRIDEYLEFSEPINEPVTVTWTLRLREGQTKTGTFTLRIASARDPLDDYLKHSQETRDRSEHRIELDPPWKPSR